MAPPNGHADLLWVAGGHVSLRSLPPLLGLWALCVILTFTSAGSRIHHILIQDLFESLSIPAGEPTNAWSEDGAVLTATTRGRHWLGSPMMDFMSRGPAV